MKIRRIKSIKNYKSFIDFEWQKFCRDKGGQESIFGKFTAVFGENGSGKSSVCDILKSLSQVQDFDNPPQLAEIEVSDQLHKYAGGQWSHGNLAKNSLLFFDVDFINANVHTHGKRASSLQQGGHTQSAGKLIIDLDQQANSLKDVVRKKKEDLEALEKANSAILALQLSPNDREFFRLYKHYDDPTGKAVAAKAHEQSKALEVEIDSLETSNAKHSEIAQLAMVNGIVADLSFSSKETIVELFAHQLKERAQDDADAKIKAHFAKHKKFIEFAKDRIPFNYQDENCPLCMQPLVNATKVIEYYRAAFDQTYDNEKRKFLADIHAAKMQLDSLKSSLV
jgi:DNA repair exonuclease SbcCD ATPase subunit